MKAQKAPVAATVVFFSLVFVGIALWLFVLSGAEEKMPAAETGTEEALQTENTANSKTNAVTGEGSEIEAIPITKNELENIDKDLHGLFLGAVISFDSKTITMREFVSKYFFPGGGPAYGYYFGPDNGDEAIWYDSSETPDPLNRFPVGAEYVKIKIDNINWLAINCYNIPENVVNGANTDDYLYIKGYDSATNSSKLVLADYRYVYDGYIYQLSGGFDVESSFSCTGCEPLGDGTYEVSVENRFFFMGENDETVIHVTKAIIVPKTIFGERHWTIINAQDINDSF